MQWWRQNAGLFLAIATAALNVLAVQATSVARKSMLSRARGLITD